MRSTTLGVAAAISMLIASSNTADAAPLGSASRVLGTSPAMVAKHELRMTNAPAAYRELCGTGCAGGSRSAVIAPPSLYALAWTINQEINKDHKSGTACPDVALIKKDRLVSMGVPADAMAREVLINGSGAGRAALVIKTSKGELILDEAGMRSRSEAGISETWI